MLRLPKVFKEVVIEETQNNKWKEFCFNTGGTPSTLQDIKVIPSASGYCFQEAKHRFLYWRTNYDVLELIEHSLDTNLLNNQLRIRFEESPILDGIAVFETEENVILLLPTVSSVHKLVFPHPLCDRSHDVCALSIFSDININNIRDPTSFYFFNSTPNIPHCATCILTANNDALFCLALNNGTLLLVRLENQTGMSTSSYLKLDSGIPRLLFGLTEMFRGNRVDDYHVVVSLVMNQTDDDIRLFALNRSGHLRVFSCTSLNCLHNMPLVPAGYVPSVGADRNILRKNKMGMNLVLVAYISMVEGSQLIVLKENTRANGFQLSICTTIQTPEDHDLVEMITECNGEVIWSIWRSKITGMTMITAISNTAGSWNFCVSESNVLSEEEISQTIPDHISHNAYYLDRIFEPGAFSATIITKVLNLIRESDPVELGLSKMELQSLVYETIEDEILKEVADVQLNEADYVELVSSHWNRFYTNCLQYQEDGKQASGLIWLNSSALLVVIAKGNLSFFRHTDVLEDDLISSAETDEMRIYRFLINAIKALNFTTDQKIKLHETLSNMNDLKTVISEVVVEVRCVDAFKTKIETLLKYDELPGALRKLCNILYMPETFENSDERSDLFRSHIGHKIVAASAKQIIQCRLDVSYKFAIMLSLLDNTKLKEEYLSDVYNFCRAYSVLNFCCKSVITNNRDMISILELVLRQSDFLRQNMLLDTIWALCEHLWCLTKSKSLAEFLMFNKQYLLVEDYARFLNYKCGSWKSILMESYLEMNEPLKAFNMIRYEGDVFSLLEIIHMFESYGHSYFVIMLTDLAIVNAQPGDQHLPTLHAIAFKHNLKLQNFDAAYASMVSNSDDLKRTDNLSELVVVLINMGAIDKLLEFSYTGLLGKLEDILHKRARSLPVEQSDAYYKFLYAFHVRHGNHRKAATVMFEQGFRAESNDVQRRCYVACLNCLSLIDPLHAWVLTSKTGADTENGDGTIDVWELADIYREYELASARCKLEDCPPSCSAEEVVAGLISIRLFKNALKVACLCKLKLEPVFEALVTTCVHVTKDENPWEWLISNDTTELVVANTHPSAVSMRLLEVLLMEYEEPNMTVLHKAVVKQMLTLKASLPFWIQSSYKKRNASELLRLYLNYGVIEETVKLACGILQAALTGKDAASYGITQPVSINSPVMCVPVNTLDLLLLELRHHKMNDYFLVVKNNIDAYLNTVVSLTRDKLAFKRR